MRCIRGARSRNATSIRVVHRSGGSNTWESEERIGAGVITVAFLLSTSLLLWIDPQGSELCGQTLDPLVRLLSALAFLFSPPVCLLGALLFLLVRCQNPGPTGIIAP